MKALKGELISLRALEPEDLETLYRWENDPEVWTISNTHSPFSRFLLQKFIEVSGQDIYESKQLRLMMDCLKNGDTVGIIDLFEFDPYHNRIGIGILVDKKSRNKGYAGEAIRLARDYAFEILKVHQLFCNIMEDNEISLTLFLKSGFEITGNKKEWVRTENGYRNELILQCIRNES